MKKQRLHSRLTYVSMAFTAILASTGLLYINIVGREELPPGAGIAFNIFLAFVLLVLFVMAVKLKRVYIMESALLVKELLGNNERRIAFEAIEEVNIVFPFFFDPLTTRITYYTNGIKKRVYVIKSVKWLEQANLGLHQGMAQYRKRV